MDPMHNFRTQLLETKLYLSLKKKKKKKNKIEHVQNRVCSKQPIPK